MIEIVEKDITAIRDYCRLSARLLRRPIRMRPQEIKTLRPDLIRSYKRVWDTRGAAAGASWHEDMYDSGELRWGMTLRKPEPGTPPNRLTKPKQRHFPFRLVVQGGAIVVTSRARTSEVALQWGMYLVPDPGGLTAAAELVADHCRARLTDLWKGERVRA